MIVVRTITTLAFVLFCVLVKAQSETLPEEKWHHDYTEIVSNLCDSTETLKTIRGFLQYLSYDEKMALWEQYKGRVLEYVLLVHLSPSYQVDSLHVIVVGQNMDEKPAWVDSLTNGMRQKLESWPECSLPIEFAHETWTVVIPYSYYSLDLNQEEVRDRVSTSALKRVVSEYAKSSLAVVFPIYVSGWSIIH
jgi:hypothetical protein